MAGLLLGFGAGTVLSFPSAFIFPLCLLTADVNAVDQEDTTPLYSAIKFNKKNLIKFLLENGASIEQKNSGGYTVLHILAKKGDVEILELLLRNAPSKHVVNSMSLPYFTRFLSRYFPGNPHPPDPAFQ